MRILLPFVFYIYRRMHFGGFHFWYHLLRSADYLQYAIECFAEEGLFRVIIIGYACNQFGVVLSAVVYGLAHLILFRWRMIIVCLGLGLMLGGVYVLLPHPTNYLVCVTIHFGVGTVAYKLGWMERWEK